VVLRNWILAMLFVAASAQGYGQSQFPKASDVTTTPSLYEILEFENFSGNPEDFKLQHDHLVETLKAAKINNPDQAKTHDNTLARVEEAYGVLSNPVSKYIYDAKLLTYLSGKVSGYYAFDLKPWNTLKEVDGRLDQIAATVTAPPVGAQQYYPDEALQKLKEFRRIQETVATGSIGKAKEYLGYGSTKKIYDKNLSRMNPLTKNMDLTGRVATGITSFTLNSLWFMVGQSGYLYLQCQIFNDPSICNAASDQWSDGGQMAGLILFGVGSEAASRTWRRIGIPAQYSNFLGMPFGSLANHYEQKLIGAKEKKAFEANFHEYYINLIKKWGAMVGYRDHLGEAIQQAIVATSSGDPSLRKQAQDKLAQLNASYNAASAQCDLYRGKWFDSTKRIYNEWATFAPGEKEDLTISSARLVTDSLILARAHIIFKGLSSKQIFKEKYQDRAFKSLSESEKTQYQSLQRDIQELKKRRDIDPKPFEQNKKFMTELTSKDLKRVALFKKGYVAYVTQQVDGAVERAIGQGPAFLTAPLSRVKNAAASTGRFLFPDMSGLAEGEITSSLGTKIFLGKLIPGAFMGILNAMQFLAVDDILSAGGTEISNTFSLQRNAEAPLNELPSLTSSYVTSGDVRYITQMQKKLSEFDEVWKYYREKVISRNLLMTLERWNGQRDKHAEDINKKVMWFNFLVKSQKMMLAKNPMANPDNIVPDYNDPDFVRNGGDPSQAWHADLDTPDLLKNEQEYYQGLVKPHFNESAMHDELKKAREDEDQFEFSTAFEMHTVLKRLVPRDYWGKDGPPAWRNMANYLQGLNAVADAFSEVGNGYWDYTKSLYQSLLHANFDILKNSLKNSARDLSRPVFSVPDNWNDTFNEELQYLIFSCNYVLDSLPHTVLVTQLADACRDPSNKIVDVLKNEAFSKRLEELRSQDPGKQHTSLGAKNPEDRADLVAILLQNTMVSTEMNRENLTDNYTQLLSAPENAQQAAVIIKKQEAEEAKAEAAAAAAAATAKPERGSEQDRYLNCLNEACTERLDDNMAAAEAAKKRAPTQPAPPSSQPHN
jgi:hypothetical protein